MQLLLMSLYQFIRSSSENSVQEAVRHDFAQLLCMDELTEQHAQDGDVQGCARDQHSDWEVCSRVRQESELALLVSGCQILSLGVMSMTTRAEIMTLFIECGTEGVRKWVALPRSNEFSCDFFHFANDNQIFRSYRMRKSSFVKLCELLKPYIERQVTRFKKPLSVELRVAVYLHWAGHAIDLSVLDNMYGIGRSTAGQIIWDVTTNLLEDNVYRQYVFFPDREEAQKLSMITEAITNIKLPQCFMFHDGVHVPIRKPAEYGEDYFNRSGYYSATTLMACDVFRRIRFVFSGTPGSAHDARLWKDSGIEQLLEQISPIDCPADAVRTIAIGDGQGDTVKIPLFTLGDSAFENSYNRATTFDQGQMRACPHTKQLNKQLSSARYSVECAFGILKGRFRILQTPFQCAINTPERVTHHIDACAVLHNFCIAENDKWELTEEEERELTVSYNERFSADDEGVYDFHEVQDGRGFKVRDELLRYVEYLHGIGAP